MARGSAALGSAAARERIHSRACETDCAGLARARIAHGVRARSLAPVWSAAAVAYCAQACVQSLWRSDHAVRLRFCAASAPPAPPA